MTNVNHRTNKLLNIGGNKLKKQLKEPPMYWFTKLLNVEIAEAILGNKLAINKLIGVKTIAINFFARPNIPFNNAFITRVRSPYLVMMLYFGIYQRISF